MRFIGETSITTLLTLIKTEIAKYFPNPTNTGSTGQVLKKTSSGSQWSALAPNSTGLLKGNGSGGITTATAGTDYLKTAPVSSVNGKTGAVTVAVPPTTSLLLKGNGSGGMIAATRGTDYMSSGNIVKQTLVSSDTTPSANYEINWTYG